MKVFTRDYRIIGAYHPVWNDYFGHLKPCVLDIESTGLDRSGCKVVLIGLLMHTESGVRVTQFLAENHYEEEKVLDAAIEYLEENEAGYLVTFNGAAFDVPFINARLARLYGGSGLYEGGYGAEDGRSKHPETPSIRLYNFDLYRFLQKCTDLRTRVSSMSQKSLEDHYGMLSDRGDIISGREHIALFNQYAISGNSTIEKIILTHNREDVLHLHRLMYAALAEVPDMHQALAVYGLPAADGRLSARPHIKRSGSKKAPVYTLKINGEQITDPIAAAYFHDADQPATAVFNAGSRSFEIELPLGHHGGECYLDLSFLTKKSSEDGSLSQHIRFSDDLAALRSDPDCINDFLILGPRTINLAARLISEYYLSVIHIADV